MKSPSFQFYPSDFLMGTMFWEAHEVGAYIRLLCYQWDKGFIEKDEKILKKITGISSKKLQKVLEKFTENEQGKLINSRLEKERFKQENRRNALADNGKLGGRPRKNDNLNESKEKPIGYFSDNLTESLPSSSSLSSSINNIIKEKVKKEKVDLKTQCTPFVEKYGQKMIDAFLNYWTEKNTSGEEKWTKQKFFEVPKRLATWSNNGFSIKPTPAPNSPDNFRKEFTKI